MKNQTRTMIALFSAAVLLLALTSGFAVAAKGKPMTPQLAAKKENVRKQHEQRVTHAQRKAAAQSLKAERLRVYNAKQGIQQTSPVIENK